MEVLGGAASVIAVVDIAGKVLSLCWKYYSAVKDAKTDIDRLCKEIEAVQGVLKQAQELAKGPKASKLLASKPLIEKIPSELREEFARLEEQLDPGKRRKAMHTFGLRALKWPLTSEQVDKTLRVLERHKTTLLTALTTDQMTVVLGIEDRTHEQSTNLSKLPCAQGAAYNHWIWQHEDRCLPDTRVELRRQIMAWSQDPKAACIFWLNGMAGTGKSTISRTVASDLANEKRLAASFFFSRGRGDISHAGKFFTTIAAQLASRLPALRPSISKAVKDHFDISQRGLSEQWKHLIFEPLSSLENIQAHSTTLVVVIDALDECEGEDDIKVILQLLAEAKNLTTIRLRVFVTSRPETPIRLGFRKMSGETHQDFVLHEIPPPIVSHDISVFFQHRLAGVKAERGWSTPWPGDQTIEQLVEKAAGLFIYAATTCRFIQDKKYNPKDRLALILKGGAAGQSSTKQLDGIYTQVLRHSIIEGCDMSEHKELLGRFTKIVGSIVTMFDVMAVKCLSKLLALPEWVVEVTLDSLRSVLDVPDLEDQPVRIFHPSFRDFLLDRERCFDSRFWIDEKERHISLFRNCLTLMSKHLRKDICDLRAPGTLTSEVSKDSIQNAVPSDVQYACRYWVHHFQRGSSEPRDYERILQFLQQDFLHWLEALGLVGRVAEGILMVRTLESALTLVASASRDKTVRLWDAAMGALRSTLEGHSGTVTAAVFSPDGKLVASASNDNTVRLWDAATGALHSTLEGHSDTVRAVVFSPDGKLVASASYDNTVRLWDITQKKTIEVIDTGRSIRHLSFSDNGTQLHTDRGILELKHSTKAKAKAKDPLLASSSSPLYVNAQWVTYEWDVAPVLTRNRFLPGKLPRSV
ncbi:hypothetical protein H2201_009008 [Coniosporium apollinis]|uniref:Nephrocystin 3-like N-terminal domain-containing protein n=1 Tax=Coniosporium apollinis TaxID=61459 RepID=A0ABQ9NIX3_9PEZI|nr:hypothetical protein H2201_009008 [Coniosporium apollinis]